MPPKVREVPASIDGWRSEADLRLLPSLRHTVRAAGEAVCEKLSRLTAQASDGTAHVDMTLFSKYLQRILRQVQRLADHLAGAAPLDRVQELIVGWSGTTGMPTVTTTPTPFGADMRTNT
jgi:hypothetical protein